jgi:prolyl-tRNA synthetase
VVLLVKDDAGAGGVASKVADELRGAGVRTKLDDRVDTSFGRRATDWELKGVPLRIEVGPRDLAEGNVTIVRRDTGEKQPIAVAAAVARVAELVDSVQSDMLQAAIDRREASTTDCSTLDEVREAAQAGFARAPWSVIGEEGEAALANAAVTVRVLQRPDGSVPLSEDEPDLVAWCAKAY